MSSILVAGNPEGRKKEHKVPPWVAALTPRDWLLDGSPIRSKWQRECFASLDWSKAWLDMGPSVAGNPGPYWHVPDAKGDCTHRLYPKLLQTKWLLLVRQVAAECAVSSALAATPKRNSL